MEIKITTYRGEDCINHGAASTLLPEFAKEIESLVKDPSYINWTRKDKDNKFIITAYLYLENEELVFRMKSDNHYSNKFPFLAVSFLERKAEPGKEERGGRDLADGIVQDRSDIEKIVNQALRSFIWINTEVTNIKFLYTNEVKELEE